MLISARFFHEYILRDINCLYFIMNYIRNTTYTEDHCLYDEYSLIKKKKVQGRMQCFRKGDLGTC